MTRIGMIGAGALGVYHAVRLQQLGATIAGVYDTLPATAEKVASDFGATVYDSVEKLIQAVDVVDVCTPPLFHRDAVVAALEAGQPVICEKPLARHLEDGIAMVRASEQTGTPLYVAHVVRFFPEFARAHRLIADGAIGKPGVYRSHRVAGYPQWSTWYGDETMSGGVLLDVLIHDFDFARWCMGEVERIHVRRARWLGPPPGEHVFALLRFAGGAIGHIEGGWSRPPNRFFTRAEIAGDGGLIESQYRMTDTIEVALHSGERVGFAPLPPDDPYVAELRHFLACIEGKEEPIITARDALAALRVSLAGMESATTGRPVTIAPLEDL
jgi:UDP-N-acetylglucosamine 3-dehydrogenase